MAAPPGNVLFLENRPIECTETVLSMLFRSVARTAARPVRVPRVTSHAGVGVRWNHTTRPESWRMRLARITFPRLQGSAARTYTAGEPPLDLLRVGCLGAALRWLREAPSAGQRRGAVLRSRCTPVNSTHAAHDLNSARAHAPSHGLGAPLSDSGFALQGIGFVEFDHEDQATAALGGLQASRESASGRSCMGAIFS